MKTTKKVSKTFTARYDILSDVIVSPTRIEIVNKLSDHPTGLPYEEIISLIPKERQEVNIKYHLNDLIQKNIIEEQSSGKYALSELGKETYNMLVNIASRAKSEKIFSNTY